jgi:DUF4097 and DUF4098 domain-containing protein YvlB
MPKFDHSGPVQLNAKIHAGHLTLVASDTKVVSVEVDPRDPERDADVRAAADARVELAGDTLTVKTSRQGFGWARTGAVSVRIEVPALSRLDVQMEVGDIVADGAFGDATVKSGAGTIGLGEVAKLRMISGAGDIAVARAGGDVLAVTGSGAVRIDEAGGDIIIKNGNGTTTIGTVAGTVRVSAANGDVAIARADRAATVKTANGSIRLGSIASGDVDLKTAFGTVEVGIAHGTAARLDVKTTFGLLRQELEPSATPPASVRTATVKARTSHGDITIRRAAADGDAEAAAA